MTDYALNLDAPVDSDLAPDPLAPLADYLEPHERDLALMVAFARFLLSEGELAAVCGTDDPLRVDYSGAVEEAMQLFPAGRGYSDGVEITAAKRGINGKDECLQGDRLRDEIYSSMLTHHCWLTVDNPLTVGNLEHRGEGGLGPGHIRWVQPEWFDRHHHK